MLDLHARVHLDEVERAVLEQELEGADAVVADLPAGLGAALADLGDQSAGRSRRRRLLEHLLVAALQRAVAAAEPERVAVCVGEHLDLDMARVAEELLDVDLRVAEGAARFLPGQRQRVQQCRSSRSTTRMPRPPPPPAALRMTG